MDHKEYILLGRDQAAALMESGKLSMDYKPVSMRWSVSLQKESLPFLE